MTAEQFDILEALGVVRNPKIAAALRAVLFQGAVPHQAAVANHIAPPRIYEAQKRVRLVHQQLIDVYAK